MSHLGKLATERGSGCILVLASAIVVDWNAHINWSCDLNIGTAFDIGNDVRGEAKLLSVLLVGEEKGGPKRDVSASAWGGGPNSGSVEGTFALLRGSDKACIHFI